MEWVGLVLVFALALGALLALAPSIEGRRLGEVIADRISCSARGNCGSEGERGGSAEPPRHVSAETPRRPAAAIPLPIRRAAGAVTRRAWIACIGYRRYRYEREHPGRLDLMQRMPVKDGLAIANACLNPYSFLAD